MHPYPPLLSTSPSNSATPTRRAWPGLRVNSSSLTLAFATAFTTAFATAFTTAFATAFATALATAFANPAFAAPGRTVLQDGHLDLVFNYTASGWSTGVEDDDSGNSFAFNEVVLHFNNHDFPQGHRVPSRPADPSWDFLGVGPGQPFYNAPPFRTATEPGARQIEPGFSATQTPSALIAPYTESDSRVSSSPTRWMRLELVAHRHWGATPGQVSLWRAGNPPRIHWSTALPPAEGNVWFLVPGAHDHMDWALSHPGIYEIDLRASAFLNDGDMTPTASEVVTVTFVAGPMPRPYAWWAQSHYSPAEWLDGDAEPDQPTPNTPDLTNAVAYALGLPPRAPHPPSLQPGLVPTPDGPAFRFTRPATALPGLTVEIEHSSDLAHWSVLARSLQGAPFSLLMPDATLTHSAPDPETDRVTLTARAPAAPRSFYRLRVTLD